MIVGGIVFERVYNKDLELNELRTIIDFKQEISDKQDAGALYYLICAFDKMNGKSYKDLNFCERMEVLSRLDSCQIKLNNTIKDLKSFIKDRK